MRILVEPNAHHVLNIGDAAMLQVALERLHELWPDAALDVITESPERLARLHPTARAVPATGRAMWFGSLSATVTGRLPAVLRERMAGAEVRLRQRSPRVYAGGLRSRQRLLRRPVGELAAFIDAVERADLLVVTGAGALTDVFAPTALTILDLVEWFRRRDVPVVMMGQGVGPISDAALERRCSAVLPSVDLIGTRERLSGPALLRRFAVADAKVVVTGDDAVGLARRATAERPARTLGLNLRRARYSALSEEDEMSLRTVVERFVADAGADVVPLPVSFVAKESDVVTIASVGGRLTDGADDEWLAPEAVAARAGGCRAVLTGSYHAAVFALAQGRPVVGIAASPYYEQKFNGLVDLFGAACQTVVLGSGWQERATAALASAWGADDATVDAARAAAAEQEQWGRAAYCRIADIVSGAA